LLPEQIDAIIAHGSPSDHFTLKAPLGGVVVAQNVKEGSYVKTGEPLFRIVDLSRLWLQMEAYESDLPWLHFGQEVTFTVEAHPGRTFSGQISFIAPEIDARSRTATVRVNVTNPNELLKPGMFARGTVESRLAATGTVQLPDLRGKWVSPMHPEVVKDAPGDCDVCGMALVPAESLGLVREAPPEAPLLVPASAVLITGRRGVVYVSLPETEMPTFQGREIELGPRAGEHYLVASGLEEGERVVTHGAFKIDSALQIQAQPSMMNPADATPPGGTVPAPYLELQSVLAAQLLPSYFALQTALANDDLSAAQAALRDMMSATGHQGNLPDLLHLMLEAEELDALRRPHFETLSNAFAAAVRADPGAFDSPVHLMHCPMVYDDRGADWLQPDSTLRNPYFGAMMLRCGEVRGRIDQAEATDAHAGHQH
jgi:Cu(I)/Ag(I) efflux system membrane fusion protein